MEKVRKARHKILETIGPTQSGGTERHLITLLEGIDKEKFLVEVACFTQGPFVRKVRELGIQTTVFPRNKHLFLNIFPNFVKFLRLKKFELLHTHTARLALLAAALERVPVRIETRHGIGREDLGNQFVRNLYDRFKSSFSEIIIVPDEKTKAFLISRARINAKKIVVIPNGIDLSRFKKKVSTQVERNSLRIEENAFVVGTIGRLTKVKGQEYLIKAVQKVVSQFPQTRFIIAGAGELKGELFNLVVKLGLEPYFRFLGHRDNIEEIIQTFDLAVFPSLQEGLSLAILEVMACGKPVVATDVGGNRQLLEKNKCGFIVPVAQPEPLAEAILWLLRNPNLANAMGQRAKRLVYEKYDSKIMVKRIENLYEKLLSKEI